LKSNEVASRLLKVSYHDNCPFKSFDLTQTGWHVSNKKYTGKVVAHVTIACYKDHFVWFTSYVDDEDMLVDKTKRTKSLNEALNEVTKFMRDFE
jgi:hypothetical protein